MRFLKLYVLVGLPLIINITSFIIFAPLFISDANPTRTDFKTAGLYLSMSLITIEVISVLLVVTILSFKGKSIRGSLFGKMPKLPLWWVSITALLVTIVAGILYVNAQHNAGIEMAFNSLTQTEKLIWYLLVPIVASFCEEVLWRGFAQSQSNPGLKSLLKTNFSFALIHGVFSPIILVTTFVLGLTWSWLKEQTNSTIPGLVLHFMSRYLGLIF